MENNLMTFDKLLESVDRYIKKEASIDLIKKAYQIANDAHKHQFRKSGEPYIHHPLEVAYILTTLNAGPKTIVAGILHDVVEDTDITYDDLKEEFDEEIATLVDGVTKLTRIKFTSDKEMINENHRKIFVGMSKDVRVIIIKLADRLHNMRTLVSMPKEKQYRIANETLEIFSPIAHRLGMYQLKSELEDLSLRYLKPNVYYNIVELLQMKKREREDNINKMSQEISDLLTDQNISFEISGRVKNIYSIYKKMSKRNKKFNEIYDLLALRIIVDTEFECYGTLGLIHAKWRPIPGRFKDYIAMPKPNMYQSLHTALIGPHGQTYEIQIRTHEMNSVAEFGVASHWAYKENKTISTEEEQREIGEKLTWFRALLTLQEDSENAEEFMNNLKMEVFNANVYVFTPKGEVISLPSGSTPIDFAYRIHTEVGHKMVGAIVNSQMVPLSTELHTGDVVEIKVNKQSFGPSEDWIKMVRTGSAKSKIQQFYARQRKEENTELGKEMLFKSIRTKGKSLEEVLNNENLDKVFKELKIKKIDELYLMIGTGAFTPTQIINKLLHEKEEITDELIESRINNTQEKRKVYSEHGVEVEGIDNLMINLAQCCKPIPGDQIIGYITRGKGIKVHRKICNNVHSENSENRTINVNWVGDIENRRYEADIIIKSMSREKILLDVISVISLQDADVINVQSNHKNDITTIRLTLKVRDLIQLRKVVENIKKVSHVQTVERVTK